MNVNQYLCDDLLRHGTILEHKEYVTKDTNENVRQYLIRCDGEKYFMTKINEKWDYLTRVINE